ncbi:MAG: PatU [Cyanobacteria bacterium RM1_2_2]|nr:PatU [Cyanobacteria bacterium RM1_2_2]
MNKDAEAINQFLAWLQEPDPAVTRPSGKNSSPVSDLEESGAVDLQVHTIDPLDSEVEALQSLPFESSAVFIEDTSSLELGELPAVQDRFHALIKRRLRAEIEQNPPLFPWETSLWDYETEQSAVADSLSAPLWTTQLQALNLPVPVPQAVLLQIFAECRNVIQSSLREGAKLVRIVESLFPDQSQALNEMAGLVLTASPSRSGATIPASALPESYEVANPTQQMLFSLLAARQMLDAMTLEVSLDCPQAERQWLTAAGTLSLVAEYEPASASLSVKGQLPCAGQLSLRGTTQQALAVCAEAGALKVELGNVHPDQTCALEVELDAADQSALVFTVRLTEEV